MSSDLSCSMSRCIEGKTLNKCLKAQVSMAHFKIQPVLLVGGQSSRMGKRKELLTFPDGRTVIEHALDTLRQIRCNSDTIYISMNGKHQLPDIEFIIEATASNQPSEPPTTDVVNTKVHKIIPVYDNNKGQIGPAAGLLSVHALVPDACLLVVACDYPLLEASALEQLLKEHTSPATCFVSDSGFAEPLIAVWGVEALERLKENVADGNNGLNAVIKQLGGKMIAPLNHEWTKGTNTPQEWEDAMSVLRARNR